MRISPEEEYENLDVLGKFLGYGKIDTNYFFFGIDEKKTSDDDTKRMKIYKNKYNQAKEEYFTLASKDFQEFYRNKNSELEKDKGYAKKSSLYNVYKKIYNTLAKQNVIENFDLWDNNILMGNISPIARKGTNESYSITEQKWCSENLEKREKYIIKYLSNIPNEKYVFCFGRTKYLKDKWENITSIKFKTCTFNNLSKGNETYFEAENKNIYLLYHPSYNWLSEKQVKELLTKLL